MWSRIEKVRARLLQWLHWTNPEDILIMTLTFRDREISAVEAQKRFHSLWSNLFSEKVAGRYFCVLQYQRVRWWMGEHFGTPHYHLIIVWPGIRKGCRYHASNGTWTYGPELQALEALFVEKHEEYGFGPQHRFEPLRNDSPVKAAVSYIVRYLQKGISDAIGRSVYVSREILVGPRKVKTLKFRKVVPRSYRFGRQALPTGLRTTLLTWGQRKRRAIAVFCVDHQVDMESIPDLAMEKYHWMHPGFALLTFWKEVIIPHLIWADSQPF
jgi:hypothetical protein